MADASAGARGLEPSPPTPARPLLVLSSRNAHKLAEVRRILAPFGIDLEPLPPGVELPAEDGDTFVDNALPKARAAAASLGRAAIADDSGICADALDGAPGVRSARFAGELCERRTEPSQADGRGAGGFTAQVCVRARLRGVAGRRAPWPERVFEGSCAGRLASERRGSGGFGYDPAFIPDELPEGTGADTTMAELSDEQKDAISHRGRAVRALAEWLNA